MNRLSAFAIAAILLARAAAGQCAGYGLNLATTGGRLGDPFSISLTGTPGISGLLGFDVAPGPILTPVGPVCLGLTPALQVEPFSLNAAGAFAISGVLAPNPALSGLSVFLQAGAADATQAGGFALSNGASATVHSPRLFVIQPGPSGTYPSPMGGRWTVYDVLAGTSGPVFPLPSVVIDAAPIPALDWIAFTFLDGSIMAYDASTGSLMWGVNVASTPVSLHRLAVDGTRLLALEGNIYPTNTLRAFSITAGSQSSFTLPLPSTMNTMITAPGSGHVYLPSGPTLVPVNLATGAMLPPINVGVGGGGTATWVRHSNLIYGLIFPTGGGAGINAVNTSTSTAVLAAPATIPYSSTPCFGCPAPFVRYGPGSTGPSLFVHDVPASSLLEVSATTFATTSAPISLGAIPARLEPSNGGSEWLMLLTQCGAGGGCSAWTYSFTLTRMDPVTHALIATGQLTGDPTATAILPLRSATLNKAFLVAGDYFTGTAIQPLDTDPAAIIQPPIQIPITTPLPGPGLRAVVD